MNSTFQKNKQVTRHSWCRASEGRGLVLDDMKSNSGASVERDMVTLNEFPARLDVHEADLLDIATAVFGTDRLAERPSPSGRLKDRAHFLDWRRELHVVVPVRDSTYWSASSVRTSIERTLGELTDDEWHLDFAASPPTRTGSTQMRLPSSSDGRPVALFSGGLDSLAGTILHARQHRQTPWLVSIASNSHIKHQQVELFQLIRNSLGSTPEQLRFSVNNSKVELRDLGKKQRARSFLYFVIAALVARRVGATEVLVLENGVTSMNAPISPFLTSSRVTRTTHPLVLMAFEEMIQTIMDWSAFRMLAPFINSTKAEMVGAVADMRSLIARTVSCARVRTGRWCGTCTACILRRQVLWAAGLADLDREERDRHYEDDIFAEFAGNEVSDSRRWYLLATLDHVARILHDREALVFEPSLLLVANALAERLNTEPEFEMSKITELHRRYALEWLTVLDRMRVDYPKLQSIFSDLNARSEVSR